MKTNNMKNSVRKGLLLIGTLLALQGCVSAPPEVSASIPLIQDQKVYSGNYLSEDFSRIIQGATEGDTLQYQGDTILVGKEYTSALGLNCKSVRVFEKNYTGYDSTVCMTTSGWFMASSLTVKSPTPQLWEGNNNE
ncbi:hypothetical protein [Kangiella aquimarina]|uniref:Lipoprotein n=1 Tax=Kangiella aquimarina TaxID=261965 RepID=A0ABZ0X355_9GAMM|nr:hypothetical protein [Kangiella aquimarina]WQG84809.1 hypothetical protein SR900_10085 [Kangiella aquimarina]